ncbi:MAG: MltA domain-containing protein [Rhodospirillaceae bacterium]
MAKGADVRARKTLRLPVVRAILVGAMLALAGCATPETAVTGDDGGPVPPDYKVLTGWSRDNHAEAVPALLRTCKYFQALGGRELTNGRAGRASDWQPACTAAKQLPSGNGIAARHYFETWFTPLPLAAEGQEGLFTGYYESELQGSMERTPRYHVPLYAMPSNHRGALPTRARVAEGALAGRGLELLWVDDAVEAFIMEIQGSGRVRLPDGSSIGINYAGQNGQKYYPIGRYLIDQGVATPEQMNMHIIRKWLHDHPQEAQRVMNLNPSYVFFKLRPSGDPRGAATELTPRRSLAVDRSYIPLGVPLWIDLHDVPIQGGLLRTLVMAQDTGGAIKGAVRGDYFWGHGDEATYAAGVMKARGRYFMLVPRTVAAQSRQTASRP